MHFNNPKGFHYCDYKIWKCKLWLILESSFIDFRGSGFAAKML